jgi:hypothetical protein
MVEKLDYIGIREELNINTCTEYIYVCWISVTSSVVTNPFLYKKDERTPSNLRLSFLPILAFAICTVHIAYSLLCN